MSFPVGLVQITVGLGECVKLGAEDSVERTRSLTDSIYGANHKNLFRWLLPACMHACSAVSNSVTPWTVACQAPLSMGFSRQEYWSGLPFPSPGYFPSPGIKPMSPALASGFFTADPPGQAKCKIQIWHLLFKNYREFQGSNKQSIQPNVSPFWAEDIVWLLRSFVHEAILAKKGSWELLAPGQNPATWLSTGEEGGF